MSVQSDRPVVALLTDFGDRDGYAGIMRGVVLNTCPAAQVVDVANHVPAQCVDSAAFVLWNSVRWFPERTVFLCVVDPGVGTARRILAARFPCGRQAVAPDNGLLRYVLAAAEGTRVVAVNTQAFNAQPSCTFHGRDIMAPVAARLAAGAALETLGADIDAGPLGEPLVPAGRPVPGTWPARVVYVDCFGTLVLNVPHTQQLRAVRTERACVATPVAAYANGAPGTPVLVQGSCGLWEVAVRNGSAAELLRVGLNDYLEVDIGND
jgi:S-adenosylmethionine hydrolase